MQRVARILDANFNRAREALRVMEDAARFLLDDAPLTEELKTLRHELAAIERSLPDVMISRDTAGDVGCAITTTSERSRAAAADVAIAACKRLGEALRSLEEFTKVIQPDAAVALEAARYRSYELEQRLVLRLRAARPAQWRICVLLTEALCARPWLETARELIAAGVDAIQLREKNMDGGELLTRARQLRAMAHEQATAERRTAIIVNDRLDVAMAAEADGVHLGQSDLPVSAARRIAPAAMVIGVSTHNLDEAERAVANGASYCGVGCMFPSATQPGAPMAGAAYLRAFVERFPDMPHLAIGGITAANVQQLAEAGARGIAVSSAVCGSDNPAAVMQALRNCMKAAQP